MLHAAVDEQQVRQRGEFFIAIQIPAAAALQHLRHGAVVVGAGAGLDLEPAVVPLQGPPVHEHHHAGHLIGAAGVGDVVALHAAGQGGQLRQLLQKPERPGGALGVGGDTLHLLPGIAVGDIQQLPALAALGYTEGDGVAAALCQQGGQGIHILDGQGEQDLPGQHLAIQIVLGHHGAQQRGVVLGGGQHLHPAAQQVAVLDVQHGAAGPGGPVYTPHTSVSAQMPAMTFWFLDRTASART